MDIEKLSDIEHLMIKLVYCKGIGIVGRWKIIKFCQQVETTALKVEEMIKIANIYQYQGVFRKSWSLLDNEKLKEELRKQKFVTFYSPNYPQALKPLPYPPMLLFYEGNLELLEMPAVSFVGARQATNYGKKVAWSFVSELVNHQYTIISGLAKGVDCASHAAAISAKGNTIGIIGCGLDTCYPKEAKDLFGKMKKEQLVLSEYPQKTPVRRDHFPMRNRIIAGLSQGTVVIEAKEKSGSLITAQQALEFGKEVFAVPGEILRGQSNGCHRLIQDGAKCVYRIEDILEELPSF